MKHRFSHLQYAGIDKIVIWQKQRKHLISFNDTIWITSGFRAFSSARDSFITTTANARATKADKKTVVFFICVPANCLITF